MSGSPQLSTLSWAEVPLLTPKGFKGLAKGDELPDSCRVSFGIQVGEVEVDPTKRQVRFIGSKSSPDSSDDEIVQSGLNWARFDRNPVFLWSHDAGSPIGVVTAHETSGERVEKTNITVSYFPPEISPLAETAFAMIQYRKQLRALKDRGGAASIGIDPKEWERKDPDDWWSGIIFQKSDVLEFSQVSLPAHADALVINALKGDGLADPLFKWAAGIAEKSGVLWVEKKRAEQIIRTLDPSKGLEVFTMKSDAPDFSAITESAARIEAAAEKMSAAAEKIASAAEKSSPPPEKKSVAEEGGKEKEIDFASATDEEVDKFIDELPDEEVDKLLSEVLEKEVDAEIIAKTGRLPY